MTDLLWARPALLQGEHFNAEEKGKARPALNVRWGCLCRPRVALRRSACLNSFVLGFSDPGDAGSDWLPRMKVSFLHFLVGLVA